jgi:hypothetical protein
MSVIKPNHQVGGMRALFQLDAGSSVSTIRNTSRKLGSSFQNPQTTSTKTLFCRIRST